ncbi:hypothetical protein RHGRI_015892 [Rhododendron griersonianum]|uniref:Uncharacterized protein n=1 Tax=Rhododendron griersonianum TaxID=479676 RepID=A0AAV6JP25_9ERIC|nr:hypothetical protein RHGRI_015892 [Rhododendron griersonianum]
MFLQNIFVGLRRGPRTASKYQVAAVLPADARPLAIANLNAHCEGSVSLNPNTTFLWFAIDPNTVTLIASVAPPVKMPSEGSEKSVEAEREGIHPKLKKSIEQRGRASIQNS